MSSISNDKVQDRLRHLQGDGDRNYSAAALGPAGAAAGASAKAESEDPISVSLHMEALGQNVVESNHKVSSAISFVQTQGQILNRFSNAFQQMTELKGSPSEEANPDPSAQDDYRNLVSDLPRVEEAKFNNEPLFNAPPLRVSIYHNEPEPHVSAVDLERPDLASIYKVSRPEGIPVPLSNIEVEDIPNTWLDEALARVGDLLYSNNEQEIELEEVRNTLNTGTTENVRGMSPPQAEELVADAGKLVLSSLDTGNAYKVQAHLSFGAVNILLK